MSEARFKFPQFFITAPQPCPYMEGRLERKLFTHLSGPDAVEVNDRLSATGFRRSQTIAYRPQCEGCQACQSLRVVTPLFEPDKGFKRILNKNRDLIAREVAPLATEEQYELFNAYLAHRHAQGGMDEMSDEDYRGMVENSSVDTVLIEYRRPRPGSTDGGPLVAVALCDRLKDGWSMVYSFFDPAEEKKSLGSYMILERIEDARTRGLPYVYLGYWIEDCRKMVYKTRFKPYEVLHGDVWELHTRAASE